uniref:Uncharacterized protein n=1 Tax=Cucumis sativus TaxID=3659 RepID=A0A0A0K3A5_CUCSA
MSSKAFVFLGLLLAFIAEATVETNGVEDANIVVAMVVMTSVLVAIVVATAEVAHMVHACTGAAGTLVK